MLITVLLLIILLHYFRYKSRKIMNDYDNENITINDFSIIVRNMPLNLNIA